MSNPTVNDFNFDKVLGQAINNPVHALSESSSVLSDNATPIGQYFFGVLIVFFAVFVFFCVCFLFWSVIKRKK